MNSIPTYLTHCDGRPRMCMGGDYDGKRNGADCCTRMATKELNGNYYCHRHYLQMGIIDVVNTPSKRIGNPEHVNCSHGLYMQGVNNMKKQLDILQLTLELKDCEQKEEYEKCAEIKKQIDSLETIT